MFIYWFVHVLFFFFFQAEDGIRDKLVTGVQTCALPIFGKGRKERCTPLRPETATMVGAWLRERQGQPEDPAFPNTRGGRLSRDAIECLLTKYTHLATRSCPSLKRKKVSPHVLRHAAAMDLLYHGVDRSVIALWLGHES